MKLIEHYDQSGEIQVTSLVESLISYVAKRHAKFLQHKEFMRLKLGDS